MIVISIDKLRADRLPIYGYRKGSTPVMDRLAREGIVFDDVYSHAPLTLPSHASLFTGLLPTRHGVRDNIGYSWDLGEAGRARRRHENAEPCVYSRNAGDPRRERIRIDDDRFGRE